MSLLTEVRDLAKKDGVLNLRDFRAHFGKLQQKHQKLITAYLGDPPKVSNVPKEIWKQIEDEEAAAYLLLMTGVGLMALRQQGTDIDRQSKGNVSPNDLRQALAKEAVSRARWSAQQTSGSAKRRLKKVIDMAKDRDELIAPEEATAKVFTRDRAKRIVNNEYVAGNTVGARAVIAAAKKAKVEVWHVWLLGPCNHCLVCPLLHRTDSKFWGSVTHGPPLHVGCCCSTKVEFGPKEELIRSGKLVAVYPSQAQLSAAIKASGWKL